MRPLTAACLSLALISGARAADVTDQDIRQEYDRVAAEFAGKDEYRVRHILVGNQEQAQAALDRIRLGELFDDVAREMSQDPGSRQGGGDLGWHLPQDFIEEFSRTMVSLNPRGLASAPTRTRFGWHVIEVTAVRPFDFPPFEAVRERIRASLQRKAQTR